MPRQPALLILASGSPRRREILAQLGLRFAVVTSDVPEPSPEGEEAVSYARRLAELKALAVAQQDATREATWVLGADTVVVVAGRILGKPADDAQALAMLEMLAGARHVVVTAVALTRSGASTCETIDVSTAVHFRGLDREALRRYIASGEGRDKAGSYAVQGLGAGLVERIEGSYTNVVGLPACETLSLLERCGALGGWP